MNDEQLKAIRERVDDGYELWFDAFDNCCQIDQQVYADVSALLDHVAAQAERLRKLEADYRALAAQVLRIDSAGDVQMDDLEVYYGEQADMAKVQLTALIAVTTLDGIEKRRHREALESSGDRTPFADIVAGVDEDTAHGG